MSWWRPGRLDGAHDVAVDLGTAYVRLRVVGSRGIVERRSVIDGPGRPRRPLRAGVVVDVDGAARLVRDVMPLGYKLLRPRVLACVPSDADDAEQDALRAALEQAGARHVTLVPEPLAAAVGAGIDLASPYAQMVVDVGEGVTDAVVVREGRVIESAVVRRGCADLKWALAAEVQRRHGFSPAPDVLDGVLRSPGLLRPEGARVTVDLGGGRRRAVNLPAPAVRQAVDGWLSGLDVVPRLWRALTPRASCEVVETGVCLTGGGATMAGLAQRLPTLPGLRAWTASHPAHVVIAGAALIASTP